MGPGAKVLGSSHTGEPIDIPIIATELSIEPVVVGYGAISALMQQFFLVFTLEPTPSWVQARLLPLMFRNILS